MLDPENLSKSRTSNYSCVQWVVGLGVSLLMMNVGIQMGWTSPNLAQLIDDNSIIPMTTSEVSLLLSFNALGAIIGSVLVFITMEAIGHRKTIQLILVFMSISWTCLAAANSKEWIFVSQFLNGITTPMSCSAFSLFIAEVSVVEIRDNLISIATSCNAVGIIIGLVLGTYLPMKLSSIIYCVDCMLTIGLFSWLLDSPQYLLKIGLLEKAKKSAAFYSIGNDFWQKVYDKNIFKQLDNSQSMMSKFAELRFSYIRKSIIIVVMLFMMPTVAGVFCIINYMQIILDNGQFDLIHSEQFVIYANVVSVIVAFLTVNLLDKLSRRFLLVASSVCLILSLLGLGTYFYLLHNQFDVKNMQWLLSTCILLNLLTFTVGFCRFPVSILNEILSEEMRNLGSSISNLINFIWSFIILMTYQPSVDYFGEEYIFWIYAGLTIVATIYIVTVLPETKGKSFLEIRKELMK